MHLIPGKPVLVNPTHLNQIKTEAMCMKRKGFALCQKLCHIVFLQKELVSVDSYKKLDPVKVEAIKGKC